MIRAREVLAYCEQALADFEAAGPTPCWRTRWAGLVALLRAVGYVLKHIDVKQDTDLKKADDDAWKNLNASKPEPLIFHKFINEERHNVVHLYGIGARLNTIDRPRHRALEFLWRESAESLRFDHLRLLHALWSIRWARCN